MKKAGTMFIKNLRYLCLVGVIAIGLMTIVGTGGGGGGVGDVPPDDPSVDSDGDGISNYLELNGYTYDPISNTYSLWDGDASVEYFKSDPQQWSTDGDPYSDSMEVSKTNIDRSVLPPGDHPMIPGYPNFIVKLIGYTVALNSTITQTDGTEHQTGTTWNRETSDTTSTTDESHWDVSDEVSCSLTDFGASVSVSGGESHSKTRTTGNVRSKGGSEMNSAQWSLATCSNPSEAAKIKLTLQVKNVGTCTAKNVELTMNLKIGGRIVKTITTQNKIAILDRDNPFILLESDIMLTYDELRSLETGASVSLEVTQVTADVMKEEAGKWELVGDWNNYMGIARAVCANIFLDLGDGNTIDQLIYADDTETAPEVTLKDAIIWAANGQDDPEHPELGPVVRSYQTDGSLGSAKPLDGWYFSLDATTYDKAPPIEDWPKIRWAIKSQCEEKVKAYVDDYFFHQSLLEVTFVDLDGVEHPMTWDAENSYFYYDCPYNYPGAKYAYPEEKIIARTPMYDPDKPVEWQTVVEASDIGFDRCKFKDMGDGTVRDNDTGLFWLKTANCTEFEVVNQDTGLATWEWAKWDAARLAHGTCGLTDGSSRGDWRLPTIEECQKMGDYDWYRPALSNTRGDGQWEDGDPFFINMHSYWADDLFWTSTTRQATSCPPKMLPVLWSIWNNDENTFVEQCTDDQFKGRVWPVRSGK